MSAPTEPLTALAALYKERLLIERRIRTLEGQVAYLKATGELKRQKRAPCGTESRYYHHVRAGVPFPEDFGLEPCGCRLAHTRAEQRRKDARLARVGE